MNFKQPTFIARQRTRLLRGLIVWLAGIVLGALNCSAQTNIDSGPTFDSFKIITTRNIFNPNRSPGYVRPDPSRRTRPAVDSIALVGTMSYAKGKFAFFDGSSSQYKKVLEPGANIAGYTLKDVTATTVTLAANGKDFEMKVGSQLRNEAGAGWRLSSRIESPAGDDSGSTNAPAAAAAAPVGSSPQQNDVIKRLMQLRQQELK